MNAGLRSIILTAILSRCYDSGVTNVKSCLSPITSSKGMAVYSSVRNFAGYFGSEFFNEAPVCADIQNSCLISTQLGWFSRPNVKLRYIASYAT
jgi:hypothetical protein